MFKYLLFVTLITLPAIFAIENFRKCKNGGELPTYVNVTGCDSAPCDFYEGEILVAEAGFTAPYATTNLTVQLTAWKYGIRFPFPLPEELLSGCDFIEGASCPLHGGEKMVYTLVAELEGIPVEKLALEVEVSLLDDKGKQMNCMRMDAVVHNPKKIAV